MMKEDTVQQTHREKETEGGQARATFLAGTKDKVAAAVDQTLVGAAEEKLADKQAEVTVSQNKNH